MEKYIKAVLTVTHTQADFMAGNYVIKDGVVVTEKDTGMSKIGDGVTPYASLPYISEILTPAEKSLVENPNTPNSTVKLDSTGGIPSGVLANTVCPVDLYAPAARTIAQGQTNNFNHGRGVAPGMVQVFLRCEVADCGYSPGDLISVDTVKNGNDSYGATVSWNTNSITVQITNSNKFFALNEKGTGDLMYVTASNASNWRLIVRGIFFQNW